MSMMPMDPRLASPGLDMALQQNAQPKPKGGMFGGGKFGIKEALVAAINGYLAGTGNPVGMANMQMMAEGRRRQQEAAAQEENYQRTRTDGMQDWLAKQQWQLEHPNAQGPHYFEDNSGNQMAIGPDGQPKMIYQDPNPWKLVPNGMGGVVPVNMRELMAGQAPKAPVGKLTPIDEGGPGLGAPGGFPRPY